MAGQVPDDGNPTIASSNARSTKSARFSGDEIEAPLPSVKTAGEYAGSVAHESATFGDDPAPATVNDDVGQRVKSLLSGYHADIAAGEDLLGITPDVEAFATLIAAKDTAPPLSIGLFGAWGSGKTFFMRQLMRAVWRKAALAAERADTGAPFYQYIAQVEFNAWHYVEGNLWASLVEHIFGNMRLNEHDDKNVVRDRQRQMLVQLERQRAELQDAEQRARQSQQELLQAQFALSAATRRAEEQRRQLEEVTLANVVGVVLGIPEVDRQIREVLERLGWTDLEAGSARLRDTFDEAQAAARRGNSLITPLVRTPAGRRRLFWLTLILIAAPLVGLLAGWLLSGSASAWLAQAATIMTSLAALLGGVTEWLRRQTRWVSERIDDVERASKTFDSRIEREQQASLQELAAREAQVRDLAGAYAAAQQEQRKAEQQVVQAEADLKQATPDQMLAAFLQERMQSNDYRQYLGVLARVRQDFERLSDMIGAGNQAIAGAEPNGEALPVNRIVLYIDDLDRCPPRRVVEVLQAVHLLLAFPLFVVVVAVDARWMKGSLETRYRELLGGGGEQAEPLDYLEKIFQIPFWISPMNVASRRQMVHDLFQSRSQAPADPGMHQPDEAARLWQDAEVLRIEANELAFVDQLAPLLGRSPRALKRFTNLYRLMKVRLSDHERDSFLAGDAYKHVLFMLALLNNAPHVAAHFLHTLEDLASQEGQAPFGWNDLIDRLHPLPDLQTNSVWRWLEAWLLSPLAIDLRPDELARWARRVARYSFLMDSLEPEAAGVA